MSTTRKFQITARDGRARTGILHTPHGDIHTPIFMPVGTVGSVKSLSPEDLEAAGAEIILGNTYHLNLRPTSELIHQMGGLHKFMNWPHPILTDSGGFQAFSLGAMISEGVKKTSSKNSKYLKPNTQNQSIVGDTKKGALGKPRRQDPVDNEVSRKAFAPTKSGFAKITEEGVEFRSHIDGSKHFLSPQRSIDIQLNLGSDICLVLDELLSPNSTPKYITQSLERTHRWEIDSLKHFRKQVASSINPKSLIFGIVQGVQDQAIRETEAVWASQQDFDGISIGGSMGNPDDWAATEAIQQTMQWIIPHLPEEWPKHALGIGEIADFFNCSELGIDMFDCVAPTRRARNGSLYISPQAGGNLRNKFTLNVSNAKFAKDSSPIDPHCQCYTCQNYSKSYIRHLYMSGELLFHRLATIHNVHFCLQLTRQIQKSIQSQHFTKLKAIWLS